MAEADEDLIERLERAAKDRDGGDYGHAELLREAIREIQHWQTRAKEWVWD